MVVSLKFENFELRNFEFYPPPLYPTEPRPPKKVKKSLDTSLVKRAENIANENCSFKYRKPAFLAQLCCARVFICNFPLKKKILLEIFSFTGIGSINKI